MRCSLLCLPLRMDCDNGISCIGKLAVHKHMHWQAGRAARMSNAQSSPVPMPGDCVFRGEYVRKLPKAKAKTADIVFSSLDEGH